MKIYRICTEAKNVEAVKDRVRDSFACFDVKYGEGSWKQVDEKSMTIEIATSETDTATRAIVEQIARDIQQFNEQETVLVQVIECEGVFI